jgi:hypothetical protein
VLRPGFSLSAVPADVTTGLDALQVDVDVSGTRGDESAILDPVARTATFATWPDLTPLPTSRGPGGGPGSAVAFEPMSPVAAGWFALLIPRQPSGVWFDPTSFHTLPDGRAVARVHVGSAPMLRDTSVCPKPDGSTAILVTFSEAVTGPGSAAPVAVTAGPAGSEAACPVLLTYAPAPHTMVELACPTMLRPKDVVTVSVPAGVVSASGAGVPAGDSVHAVETFRPNLLMAECSSLLFEP